MSTTEIVHGQPGAEAGEAPPAPTDDQLEQRINRCVVSARDYLAKARHYAKQMKDPGKRLDALQRIAKAGAD